MKHDDDIEEYDVRQWFLKVELEQAVDTYRVVGGIIEARVDAKPKRKRRSDADKPRTESDKMQTTFLPGGRVPPE